MLKFISLQLRNFLHLVSHVFFGYLGSSSSTNTLEPPSKKATKFEEKLMYCGLEQIVLMAWNYILQLQGERER